MRFHRCTSFSPPLVRIVSNLRRCDPMVFVLLVLLMNAEGCVQAQPTRAESPYAAACSLSGQTPEGESFDPAQLQFVPKPEPVKFEGRSFELSYRMIARVVGVQPLVIEVLDSVVEPKEPNPPRPKGPCERMRIAAVDERLRGVFPALRFHDLVTATFSMGNPIGYMVLTDLAEIEGAPQYFHDASQTDVCANRSGTLVQYYSRNGGTVVVNHDGTIYYRDPVWRVFDRQRVNRDDLEQLMKALRSAGFNSLRSQVWDVGELSSQPYIALACTRFQKVMLNDYEKTLAPVVPIMEKIKATALSDTYYQLAYSEKRPIRFLDWPMTQIPLDQVEAVKREAAWEEQPNSPRASSGENLKLARLKVPPAFYVQLPQQFPPAKPDGDPNRDVYVRDGGKIFRVWHSPSRSGDATLFSINVKEIVSGETAIEGIPADRRSQPVSQLKNMWGSPGFFWPNGMGLKLSEISANRQKVTNDEYSRHELLYYDLLWTGSGGIADSGVTFLEGPFLYTNVRLDRLEGDSR